LSSTHFFDGLDRWIVNDALLIPGLSAEEFKQRKEISGKINWKRIGSGCYCVIRGCPKELIESLKGFNNSVFYRDESGKLIPITLSNAKKIKSVYVSAHEPLSVALKHLINSQ